ncbi:MAG: ATP-binding cassette domain-containing protein [Planctomycetes bacterium]|nr:ATP-binding cassette domain-containing protein [Planctomycetota bacterium]
METEKNQSGTEKAHGIESRSPLAANAAGPPQIDAGVMADAVEPAKSDRRSIEIMRLENIKLFRGDRLALDDVSVGIRKGEILAITGEERSGKSDFINIAAGLLEPSSGTVTFEDRDLYNCPYSVGQSMRTQIGFVPQEPTLITNQNIYMNIALPLRYHSRESEEHIDEKVMELVCMFGLENYLFSMPGETPIDVRSKACIARALSMDPAMLVIDEPFKSLSENQVDFVCDVIRRLQEKTGLSVLYAALSDRRHINFAHRIGTLRYGRLGKPGHTNMSRAKPAGAEDAAIHPHHSGVKLKVITSDEEEGEAGNEKKSEGVS